MPLVLVVDDEPDICDVIRLNLEAAGYRVEVAADGEAALAAIHRERPDAVFLDVLLPGIGGWAVLEHLKGGCEGCLDDVPVVMVTAMSQVEDRLRGAIEGAVRYVTKPFDPRDLVGLLDELLAPGAPPESELRRDNRRRALEALARIEAHGHERDAPETPRVRLTRLEQPPVAPAPSVRLQEARKRLGLLTPKQRELLGLLAGGTGVGEAAERLATSRSNVYANLRRVVRRLGLRSTSELLRLLAEGRLRVTSEAS